MAEASMFHLTFAPTSWNDVKIIIPPIWTIPFGVPLSGSQVYGENLVDENGFSLGGSV
jgi:hypothetical protein